MLLYFFSEGLAKFFKINKPCTQRSICIFLSFIGKMISLGKTFIFVKKLVCISRKAKKQDLSHVPRGFRCLP